MKLAPLNISPTPLPLSDRGLLLLSGKDVRAFLQGMVTCNIENLSAHRTLYGAHLSHQGRVLFDFFALNWEENVLLDCHKNTLMAFAKSLHDHKMRFQIDFDDITNDYHIYGDLTQSDALGNTVRDNATVFYTDPRLKKMGGRIITSKALPTDKSLEDYHSNRIQLAVPDAAYDCKLGKTISGELCLEYLNGVDYKKGCYMGQEMTARTHFRNPPKKRIVAIRYEGEAPPHGTQIKLGKLPVGEVYSCQNGYGIGIARVSKALEDSANLTADGKPLKAEKPQWADYIIE